MASRRVAMPPSLLLSSQQQRRTSPQQQQQHASQSHQPQASQSDARKARAGLRGQYRKLLQDTTMTKEELINPFSDTLKEKLIENKRLFSQVKNPREAVLDAEVLKTLSDYGIESTHRLNTGFYEYSSAEFINHIRTHLSQLTAEASHTQAQIIPSSEYDFTLFGKKLVYLYRSIPKPNTMAGPLNIEPRVQHRRTRERDKEVEAVEAEEEKEVDDDAIKKAAEKQISSVVSSLSQNNGTPFLEFVTDPDSFSQTVENLFFFSFLIQAGHAGVKKKDGIVVAEQAAAPKEQTEKQQCVVPLDYAMWQELRKRVSTPAIPHRNYSTRSAPSTTQSKRTTSKRSRVSQSQKSSTQTQCRRRNTATSTQVESESESESDPEPLVKRRKALRTQIRRGKMPAA